MKGKEKEKESVLPEADLTNDTLEEYKDRVEYSVIKSLKSKFGRTLDTFKSEDINEELNVSIEESVVLTIQNAKKH